MLRIFVVFFVVHGWQKEIETARANTMHGWCIAGESVNLTGSFFKLYVADIVFRVHLCVF